MPNVRLEFMTLRLRVVCSINWASQVPLNSLLPKAKNSLYILLSIYEIMKNTIQETGMHSTHLHNNSTMFKWYRNRKKKKDTGSRIHCMKAKAGLTAAVFVCFFLSLFFLKIFNLFTLKTDGEREQERKQEQG